MCYNLKKHRWFYKLSNNAFSKELSHACKYCINARSYNNTEMLCKHRGVVLLNDCCKKYKYDPLKREPQRILQNENWTAEDFELYGGYRLNCLNSDAIDFFLKNNFFKRRARSKAACTDNICLQVR